MKEKGESRVGRARRQPPSVLASLKGKTQSQPSVLESLGSLPPKRKKKKKNAPTTPDRAAQVSVAAVPIVSPKSPKKMKSNTSRSNRDRAGDAEGMDSSHATTTPEDREAAREAAAGAAIRRMNDGPSRHYISHERKMERKRRRYGVSDDHKGHFLLKYQGETSQGLLR